MTERDPVIAEALRIEEDTNYSGRSNFSAARRSDRLHVWLGGPAAVLAAVAGTTALAEQTWVAAGCAFGATLLGALHTFLRADKRAAQHQTIGAEYIDLRNEARIFRTIDFEDLSDEERRARIHELSARRSDLNRATPRIPPGAFSDAQASIERGETDYAVDRESGALPPGDPKD
jgi:hypothetical protein